jgi:ATP-dependent helicase/nuclease subunit A
MSYTINSKQVEPQQFTNIACNPNANIVVKACAGSGKTWLLASRIVRILVEGGNHTQILAITFTKKAAQEMKQRVMDYLHTFSYIDDESLLKELKIRGINLTDENITRAKNLYFKLLSSPYALNISTFHVWFAQLSSMAPISQSINYANIRDDEQIMYEDAIKDFTSSSIYSKYQSIFDEFLRKWNITSLISNDLIMQIWHKRGDILSYIHYDDLQKFAYPTNDYLENIKHKVLPSFAISKQVESLVNEAIVLLKSIKNKTSADIAIKIEQALTQNDISLFEEALLTSGNKISSTRNKDIQSEFEGLASVILQNYYDLYNQAFSEIAKIFIYAYTYYKQANNVADFNDLQTNAKFLIEQKEIAQYIWCRLDNKYKHILFDEFQDTDMTQWNIIKAWLNAYGKNEEDKPKIFIVGDLKQAIYRFRGSDSSVFIKANEYLTENYQAYTLATYNTRRCSQPIIDWLNQGLCTNNSSHDDDNYKNDYLPHTTSQNSIINNNIVLNLTENSQTSAIQLAQTIKHIHDNLNISYKDILVLSSSRKNWQDFQSQLSNFAIPCVVSQQGGLLQTQEVYILINLMRFLLNSDNDYALFCILISPIFNIDSSYILSLVNKDYADLEDLQESKSYWKILNYANSNENITTIHNAIEKLNYLLSIYKNYTPLDLMQFLYIHLDIENKFIIKNQEFNSSQTSSQSIKHNLQEFIKLVLNFNAGRYPNLNDLLDFVIKYQYTNYIKETPNLGLEQQEDAVHFDTIHGAKGLEADVVILMDSTSYKSFSTSVLEHHDKYLVGSPYMHRLVEERQFSWDYQQNEHDKEYKNLLYVAITRAKKMFVVGGIESSKTKQQDNKIWYNTLTNINDKSIYSVLELNQNSNNQNNENINTKELNLNKNIQNNIRLPKIQITIKPREIPTIGQEIGSIMDKLLELITNNKNKIPKIEQALMWLKIPLHKKFMLEIALDKVEKILNAQNLQIVFDNKSYIKAMNEQSFAYQSKIYRMDRIIQLDDNWLIIDYKFGDEQKHIEQYTKQLSLYKSILAKNLNLKLDNIKTAIINTDAEIIYI